MDKNANSMRHYDSIINLINSYNYCMVRKHNDNIDSDRVCNINISRGGNILKRHLMLEELNIIAPLFFRW